MALLGYYKYTGFVISNLNEWCGLGLPVKKMLLPVGISFFTFTQIAYLVDLYRSPDRRTSFSQLCALHLILSASPGRPHRPL